MIEKTEIDREFIPSLREGVDVVRMIFFKEMRSYLAENYSDREGAFCGLVTGAVLNEIFATPNTEEKIVKFAKENKKVISRELMAVKDNFPELLIPLTDALRIHYLCNYQEEIDGAEATLLARAKSVGILLEERDVPLPKGFMEMVYRVGKAYGLIKEQ